MQRKTLVVMVKEPRPGRVKTRLGHEIGMTRAAWWFRHQVAFLLRSITDPRWDVVLAVAPDVAGMASRVWPAHLPRLAQGTGDLGDRMRHLFRTVHTGPVCIIGADIPGIRRMHINTAFRALGRHDAVFGPATDGGFWLVGLKRPTPVPPALFANVRWSSEHALSDSLAGLKDARVYKIDVLRDVDTKADLSCFAHDGAITS